MKEAWRQCSNYPSYEVSTLGRVRRLAPASATKVGRVLKQRVNSAGYYYVSLSESGRIYTKYVHHVVAETFVGPRPFERDIHHKDDNKLNNCADNLEYVTQSENTKRAFANGRINVCKGEDHTYAVLTDNIVREVRRKLASGVSARKIALCLGVSQNTIGRIKRGQAWKHVI